MSRRSKTKSRAEELKIRHEENPFEDFQGTTSELILHKFLHWTKGHVKQVLIGAAIFIGVLSIIILTIAWSQNKEKQSLLAFEEFMASHSGSASMSSASLALEDIQKYEDQFSNSETKIRAALIKVKYLAENEDFKKAAETCEYLASNLESKDLQAYFHLRAAFLFEKVDQKDSALKAYRAVVETGATIDIVTVHAYYGEIRMLLKDNKKSVAQKVLQKLLEVKADRPDIKKLQKQALALVLTQK